MVGDLVRVLKGPDRVYGMNIEWNIKEGDIGIVVGCPAKYGDVVDIIVNGSRVRYWMGQLEIIKQH